MNMFHNVPEDQVRGWIRKAREGSDKFRLQYGLKLASLVESLLDSSEDVGEDREQPPHRPPLLVHRPQPDVVEHKVTDSEQEAIDDEQAERDSH